MLALAEYFTLVYVFISLNFFFSFFLWSSSNFVLSFVRFVVSFALFSFRLRLSDCTMETIHLLLLPFDTGCIEKVHKHISLCILPQQKWHSFDFSVQIRFEIVWNWWKSFWLFLFIAFCLLIIQVQFPHWAEFSTKPFLSPALHENGRSLFITRFWLPHFVQIKWIELLFCWMWEESAHLTRRKTPNYVQKSFVHRHFYSR